MLIDSHAHMTSSNLFEEAPLLLDRAKASGVIKLVNIATDVLSLKRGLELSKQYPWMVNAASTTPHDVDKTGESDFDIIASHVNELHAVGETGLDYYYEHSPRELQKTFLRRYLKLARDNNLPIVIHCREAFSDLFQILDEEGHCGGVLHCFTGTIEESREVIKRGLYLSLSGIVTFKKSVELQEVAKEVPLDRLLIETDAPYLAPQPYRGKVNEPAYVIETAKFLANLKNVSFETLAAQTTLNAETLFKF